MFRRQKPGWFGSQLNKNIEILKCGNLNSIPWIFCVFAEKHDQSKLAAAKALCEILDILSFDDIIRIDAQMRQTTSMEWSINWRELNVKSFFTPQMSLSDYRAVTVFASFNPNGFIRESAVHMLKEYDGTLPYIILRQNDWVQQVRKAASAAFTYRLQRLSEGEIIAALPFAEKLKWSIHGSHGEYTNQFFSVLTAPEHTSDLMSGLNNVNIRTRRICTEALFTATPPKIKLAAHRLICESEPFLRATIFRKLISLGQKMDEAIEIFLRDKYSLNRMLAFQYLIDINSDNIRETAEKLLLDKNAAIRGTAQNTIQKQTPDYDFRSFYLNNLDQYPTAAIGGLGEKGLPSDTVKIVKYLSDTRISIVKSAMASLMRLDYEEYRPVITEMLNDSRAGIVKTARNLIMKTDSPDYVKIIEIFNITAYEHTKLRCMDILFSASKWSGIIYMLEVLLVGEKQIKEKSLTAINRWLFNFNRSFTLPSAKQIADIRKLINLLREPLPSKVEKELLFVLPQICNQ